MYTDEDYKNTGLHKLYDELRDYNLRVYTKACEERAVSLSFNFAEFVDHIADTRPSLLSELASNFEFVQAYGKSDMENMKQSLYEHINNKQASREMEAAHEAAEHLFDVSAHDDAEHLFDV